MVPRVKLAYDNVRMMVTSFVEIADSPIRGFS